LQFPIIDKNAACGLKNVAYMAFKKKKKERSYYCRDLKELKRLLLLEGNCV